MELLSDSHAVRVVCDEFASDTFVTVDTEFMRERTYWPDLCLIQIAGAKANALIDPTAPGLDLSPFWALLADERVLKVFHSARQDIEIFVHRAGAVPHPVFDTQVAAMVCGFGDQVGYEAIVRKLARAEIDKSSRFTDWSKRPLSAKQLAYALSDVTHLRKVYETLRELLHKNGRESWIAEEMEVLTSIGTYRLAPQDSWRRIKARLRNRKQFAVLVAVAAWREREAQARNVPRNRVIKDDAIAEVALQSPATREALGHLRALPQGFANSRTGEAILEAVKAGLAADPKTLPHFEPHGDQMPDAAASAAEILKLALKIVAAREGIAAKLVAGSDDIESFALDRKADVPFAHGWRHELFGRAAQALLDGRAVIGFAQGRAALLDASDGKA